MKNINKILITIFTILIISTNISLANNNQQQKPQQNQQTQKEQTKQPETKKEHPKQNETIKKEVKIETQKETNKPQEKPKQGNVTEVMNKDKIKMFGRNNRQFVSFKTSEGQIFYLLIDYNDKGIEENIEVLKKISNNDINSKNNIRNIGENFEETKNEIIKSKSKFKNPKVDKNEKNINEISKEKKEKKDFNILDYAIYIVVIIVMIVILFIKKSKKNNNMEDEFNNEEKEEEETTDL